MKQKKDIYKIKGLNPFYCKNSNLKASSPMETLSNSMTTTQNTKKTFSIIWRPNNYRRQIKVKTKTNSALKNIQTTITHYSYCKHTKMLSIKGYKPNITLQYGKDTLTAIYSQNKIGGVKEHYLIETNDYNYLQQAIDNKKQEIEDKIDKTLLEFSRQFKIKLPLEKPIWKRYEDFIKGEEYIDSIPKEVIIHDTHFKKVYGQGIEFMGNDKAPTVKMKNHLRNSAINNIAPEIAEELEKLSKVIIEPYNIKKLLNKINTIQDVINNKDLILNMDRSQKKKIEMRLFENGR